MQQHNYGRMDNTVATNLSHYFPNSISSEVKYEEKILQSMLNTDMHAVLIILLYMHLGCVLCTFLAHFILGAPP